MINYDYVSCEEGASQYDDYNFKESKIVDAAYIPAIVEMDRGNPYIEALPYPKEGRNVRSVYNKPLLEYDYEKIKEMSDVKKMLNVSILRELRFPLSFHEMLEYRFYDALLASYRARKQMTFKRSKTYYTNDDEVETNTVLYGSSENSTNAGFSLIGYSGCGKSSAISTLLSHYPQVIIHDDGCGGHYPQIVYLVVNCVANSNFSALYEGIGEAIDRAFENSLPVYAGEVSKARNLGKKAEIIKSYIEQFGIGIIIFDEIQLIDFEHTKENTFDSLLTLANRTKVAMAVVGTEDARAKMFKELRTARRIGTVINGNGYCSDQEFFAFLVKSLFRYQWFDTHVVPTNGIVNALYTETKGIVDQLISLYSCMNYEYISRNKKKPAVNANFVKKVSEKYYPGIQNILSNLSANTRNAEEEFRKSREGAEYCVNELIEAERRKEIIANEEMDTIQEKELKEVVERIQKDCSKYEMRAIEDVYQKVKNRKSSEGKSLDEILKLVLEQLQKKVEKKSQKKSKKDTHKREKMSEIQMANFLGIDKGPE